MAGPDAKKSRAGKLPSQRQLRVGEVLRHRLSDALCRVDFDAKILKKTTITVTEVTLSPDLRRATAYVMPLGGEGLVKIVDLLNEEVPRLKKIALAGLRLKYTPDFKFAADNSFERAMQMDALLASQAVQRDTDTDADTDIDTNDKA